MNWSVWLTFWHNWRRQQQQQKKRNLEGCASQKLHSLKNMKKYFWYGQSKGFYYLWWLWTRLLYKVWKNPFRGLIETQKKMLDLTCLTMKFHNCHHTSFGEADNKDKWTIRKSTLTYVKLKTCSSDFINVNVANANYFFKKCSYIY